MKAKLLITVMIGLLFLPFLSSIAEAEKGGMPECTNNLNICSTKLTNAQNNYGVCTTNLTVCTTNLTNEQNNMANAQANLAACQANLATCQANLAPCSQTIPPPSWYQKLQCYIGDCPRFEVLADWANAAVLDKETGLVWEQSPSTSMYNWGDARVHCSALVTGGRSGWRLPTPHELASLVDLQSNPALPSGHPFSNVQSSRYWSATTDAEATSYAWYVTFDFAGNVGSLEKFNGLYVWCVRGGQGVNPQ